MARGEYLKVLYARDYKDRDGTQRTFWHELGMAYPTRGGGYDVVFHVMPPPNAQGQFRLVLRPQDDLEREGGGRRGGGGGGGGDARTSSRRGPPEGHSESGDAPPWSDPADDVPF